MATLETFRVLPIGQIERQVPSTNMVTHLFARKSLFQKVTSKIEIFPWVDDKLVLCTINTPTLRLGLARFWFLAELGDRKGRNNSVETLIIWVLKRPMKMIMSPSLQILPYGIFELVWARRRTGNRLDGYEREEIVFSKWLEVRKTEEGRHSAITYPCFWEGGYQKTLWLWPHLWFFS